MTVPPLYFDHNSCTPADPRVVERFVEVERSCPANPGSLHEMGRRARAVLEDAREDVARLFGVPGDRVLFVSGGTEANNIAVRTLGDQALPVALAPLEHPSVFEAAAPRGRVLWDVDAQGRAVVTRPAAAVGLCCLAHAQNELGAVQPVERAGELARELQVPLHVDAAQSIGRVPLEEVLAAADSIAFSAHKAGGLRGASVLVRPGEPEFAPLFLGGGQEAGLRPGTPSPSLAAATALALRLAVAERPERARAMRAARDAFHRGLSGVEHRVLTPQESSLPNTTMILFQAVDGRNLLPALDLAGVQVSQGSACSSGSPTPPPVLSAIGLTEVEAKRCVRFSFSHRTTIDEVEEGARRVARVVTRLRAREPA